MVHKFLQLNIWFGGKLYEELFGFLKEENADILAFQEVIKGNPNHPDQNRFNFIENIKTELGYPYHAFGADFYMTSSVFDKVVESDWGSLILSKYPIVDTSQTFYIEEYKSYNARDIKDFGILPRSILKATIKINDHEMNIFSTHGVWGTDDKDSEKRTIMSEAIIEQVKNMPNVLLSGDLNTSEETHAIHDIEEYLTNVFKGDLKTTFNMRHKDPEKGTFYKSVVDFIFASKDLKIVNKYSSDKNVSDHVPLIVEFEL